MQNEYADTAGAAVPQKEKRPQKTESAEQNKSNVYFIGRKITRQDQLIAGLASLRRGHGGFASVATGRAARRAKARLAKRARKREARNGRG